MIELRQTRDVRRHLTTVLAFAMVGACAHVRRAPLGYNVSSERSDYSPALRLAVALPVIDTSTSPTAFSVVIDSGTIVAPGTPAADTTPVMRDLYVTALLVTRSSDAGDKPPTPWRALATSDSTLIADALFLGVARPVPRIELHIDASTPIDVRQTWIVFRITGAAMTERLKMVNGDVLPARRVPGGIRVYACTDWSLAGYVDRKRAKALARAYNAAC